jgi:hypothetical protein
MKWWSARERHLKYWAIVQNQPISAVESPSLRRMTLQRTNERQFRGELPQLLEQLQARQVEILSSAIAVGGGFDDWSSVKRDKFTGIEAYALVPGRRSSDLPKYMVVTLANVPHPPGMSPNADNLADILRHNFEKVQVWGSDAFSFITADTTSVNPATVRVLGKLSLPCWAHVFNCCSGDILEQMKPEIAELLVACAVLRPCPIFEKIMRAANKQFWTLPTYTRIRWWSLLRLLNRVLKLQGAIVDALAARRDQLIAVWQKIVRRWLLTPNSNDAFEAEGEEDPDAGLGPMPALIGVVGTVVAEGEQMAYSAKRADGRELLQKDIKRANDVVQKLAGEPKISARCWKAVAITRDALAAIDTATRAVEGNGFGLTAIVLKTFDTLRDDVAGSIASQPHDTVDEEELRQKLAVGWAKAEREHWEKNLNRSPSGHAPGPLTVWPTVRSVLEFGALCSPFTWQFGPAFLDMAAAVLSMRKTLGAYNAIVPRAAAELPTQGRQALAGSPAKTSEADRMRAKLQARAGQGGLTDVGAYEPVVPKLPGDEVDDLREVASRCKLAEDLKPDELLRFVYVEMKATPVLQKLAFQVLVAPASACAVERLFSRGSNILTKKRWRLGADNLEALMVLSANHELLAEILDVDTEPDLAFLEAQLGLIIQEAHRRAHERDGE